MYKHIMLLGLLLEQPMYGQQIREVIENHHDLFAETIKKPTIYYQLERLAADGYLEIRREPVEAPGPGAAHEELALRERDVYYITEAGRHYFYTLLRAMLSQYTPGLSDLDACLSFLYRLNRDEATALLKERQDMVKNYRTIVMQQRENHHALDEAHMLVNDHKLALIDTEISWLERTINHLDTSPAQRT